MARIGWFFAWRNTRSIAPVVYLGWILGGSAVIFCNVSRMYEREGIIVAPVIVVSQYRRFYYVLVLVQRESVHDGFLGPTYIVIADNNALAVPHIYAISGSEPPFPKDAIYPCESHLLSVRL